MSFVTHKIHEPLEDSKVTDTQVLLKMTTNTRVERNTLYRMRSITQGDSE